MVDKSTSPWEGLEDLPDVDLTDYSAEELQEFLEADSQEALADSGFKQRLQGLLWDILRKQLRDD